MPRELFFNHRRTTTLLVVLSVFLIIERIDGHPFPWAKILFYEEGQPLAKESSEHIGVSLSESEAVMFSDAVERTSEIEAIRYVEPLSTFQDNRGVSQIVEISQHEQAIRLGDEDINSDEEPDREKYEEDKDHRDADDAEIHDKRNNRNNMKNIERNMKRNENNGTENVDNDILRLINEAIEGDIFLTPEQFALELGKRNETANNVTSNQKKYKTRSPVNPDDTDSETNLSGGNDGRIVFPDQMPTTNVNDFTSKTVPSCEGSTYCENLPYYPSDEFVENALRINYIEPISDPSIIYQRMGPVDSEEVRDESLCFSKTQTIIPESGLDENNEWHYILNNKKYVQKVNVEFCENEGQACRLIAPPAEGYTTLCKQKYVFRHLVAISANGTVASKPIKMPSSCCCHFKFAADISPKMGGDIRKSNQQSPVSTRPNVKSTI